MVEEYSDDGERAQPVEAGAVGESYLGCALRCEGTSVQAFAAVRGVGYLRLLQRTFRFFPPSKSRDVILAQSRRAMQG